MVEIGIGCVCTDDVSAIRKTILEQRPLDGGGERLPGAGRVAGAVAAADDEGSDRGAAGIPAGDGGGDGEGPRTRQGCDGERGGRLGGAVERSRARQVEEGRQRGSASEGAL